MEIGQANPWYRRIVKYVLLCAESDTPTVLDAMHRALSIPGGEYGRRVEPTLASFVAKTLSPQSNPPMEVAAFSVGPLAFVLFPPIAITERVKLTARQLLGPIVWIDVRAYATGRLEPISRLDILDDGLAGDGSGTLRMRVHAAVAASSFEGATSLEVLRVIPPRTREAPRNAPRVADTETPEHDGRIGGRTWAWIGLLLLLCGYKLLLHPSISPLYLLTGLGGVAAKLAWAHMKGSR